MNWCYDCIFQGVCKNRYGNAIIIASKIKISKNIRIFLNKFSEYVCALCGFNCLKVINFFHDFFRFNLRKTKRKNQVTVFLYCNYSRVEPIFHAFISGSPLLLLTGSVSLYWRIPSVVMILEKNSF